MMWAMALRTLGRRVRTYDEPTIAEMLSDSIIQEVMGADGVDPAVLEAELRSMAWTISANMRAGAFPVRNVRTIRDWLGIPVFASRAAWCAFIIYIAAVSMFGVTALGSRVFSSLLHMIGLAVV